MGPDCGGFSKSLLPVTVLQEAREKFSTDVEDNAQMDPRKASQRLAEIFRGLKIFLKEMFDSERSGNGENCENFSKPFLLCAFPSYLPAEHALNQVGKLTFAAQAPSKMKFMKGGLRVAKKWQRQHGIIKDVIPTAQASLRQKGSAVTGSTHQGNINYSNELVSLFDSCRLVGLLVAPLSCYVRITATPPDRAMPCQWAYHALQAGSNSPWALSILPLTRKILHSLHNILILWQSLWGSTTKDHCIHWERACTIDAHGMCYIYHPSQIITRMKLLFS